VRGRRSKASLASPRRGFPRLRRALPRGGFVAVALDPGIYVGHPSQLPEQTLRDVSTLTASEILAALTCFTA
jgi:hypothetical protein